MVSGYQRDEKMLLNMNNSLTFKKRSARIDWRKIASVDIDRICKELDVYTLQDNIDHLTFCNIENEIDTRMIDPNYVKLFKISQLTIEYLMHSQTYLTDVIGTIETQLESTHSEADKYKRLNEKIQKELVETKKENKKRKKMIETQQTLLNANTSNYHQCAYCSKVFLNISYLQGHMTRRHSEMQSLGMQKVPSEIEKELERIKERLRITESDLIFERNSRLSSNSNNAISNNNNNSETSLLLKQMEEMKNNELKRQKDELKQYKDNSKKTIQDLNDKTFKLEQTVKELQEKLGKTSHVGWIKDDIELEKDTVLNQLKEIEKLKETIANYEKQLKEVEDLKLKWKNKEATTKKKYTKEINEKDEEIRNLKARLAELQNSLGKSDSDLTHRIDELQSLLHQEQQLRNQYEIELNDLRNRPPPVTPRQQQVSIDRSPSPPKNIPKSNDPPVSNRNLDPTLAIYLPEYSPLTMAAVQNNRNHLDKFKDYAVQLFEKELDEMGIDINEKSLSTNDFKQKMLLLKNNRTTRTDDMAAFNQLRHAFSDITDKHANIRTNSTLRSSIGNRVTFKQDVVADDPYNRFNNQYYTNSNAAPTPKNQNNQNDYNSNHNNNGASSGAISTLISGVVGKPKNQTNQNDYNSNTNNNNNNKSSGYISALISATVGKPKSQTNQNTNNYTNDHRKLDESEETNDDVSLSNALESDEDDTEPTRSQLNEKSASQVHQDEISDLESISQLVSDRSLNRKKQSNIYNKNQNGKSSMIDETKRKLEKKIDTAAKKNFKPTPNAVPVGFQTSVKNQKNIVKNEDSFSSVSDIELDNEVKSGRPKSGVRSSGLQDSQSSSIWISESHSLDMNQQNHHHERPPTANSLKTSNFDSDEIDTGADIH